MTYVFNPLTGQLDPVQSLLVLDSRYVNVTGDTMTGNLNMGTYNLIGGTGITDILKLQSTTGNGTLTSPAIQLLTGNNGATTAVTVLNNGNVGIGTTAPAEKLHVIGNYQLSDNTTSTKSYRFRTTGSGLDFDGAGNSIYLSVYDNADYTGTQRQYMIFGHLYDYVTCFRNWEWKDSSYNVQAQINPNGGFVFNEGGTSNLDFRVESDTEANMLYLDADADTDGALYLGGTTNGLKVSKGGDLTFLGTATVYQDVNTGFAGAKVPASNAPTWTTFIGNINAYTFAVNDYIDVEALEVPHGWKEGSAIEIHIHWATNGNNDATVRGVKWEIEYTWSNMLSAGGTTAFGSIAAVSTETSIAASEPTLTHKYTSVLSFTPTGGKVGMYIKLRLKRIASVTNTAPANNPFGLAVGIHCELDKVGSRTTGAS